MAFAARVDEWWKNSSEHERAGVLQKAKQTKPFCCLVIILHHKTAFLWRSLVFFKRHKSMKIAHGHKFLQSRQSQSKIHKTVCCLSSCDEQLLSGRLIIGL